MFTGSCQGNAPALESPVIGVPLQGVEDLYRPEPEGYRVSTWVGNLNTPWELVFLPDGRGNPAPGDDKILRIVP